MRHQIPLGEPVTGELRCSVIRRAYARVPGCERLTGTHILRHTAASRLLQAEAHPKWIADLGHRSIDTTESLPHAQRVDGIPESVTQGDFRFGVADVYDSGLFRPHTSQLQKNETAQITRQQSCSSSATGKVLLKWLSSLV